MKIHTPKIPMDTILKHSQPILTPCDLRLIFYSTLPTSVWMLYSSTGNSTTETIPVFKICWF
jgi:hypothetical protein